MSSHSRFRIGAAAAAALAIAGAVAVLQRHESEAPRQATDDAYVQADLTVVAPQVAGIVSRVSVDDNQAVPAGAPLVEIDDRRLRIAVDAARSAVDSLAAQIERQTSVIGQSRAAVAASAARLRLAQANRQRFDNLARDGSGTVQALEQARAELEIQRAARERDQAALRAAEQQLPILRAELARARAARAEAELNLSYARIAAPVDGVVAQRRARVGGHARVGEPLLTLVPLDALYVEANFRETQLGRVQVGQPVDIAVDALPGVSLKGRVESLGPASGVSFSPVPPHNATGNFTKIVQRLPVRIRILPGQAAARHLRVGMSVRPRIAVDGPVASTRAP